MSPATPALQADSLPLSHWGSPNMEHNGYPILSSEVTSGYNPQNFIGDAVLWTIVAQFFKTKFKLGPVLDLKLWFPQGQYRFNQFDNFYHWEFKGRSRNKIGHLLEEQRAYNIPFSSVQFSSVTQLCLTLCDPMNRSTPGLPVHHQLLEFTQTPAHRVGDAIQPSHPLSSPSPPAPNLSQHQGLFQWVNSSYEVAKVLEFQFQHQSFQWTPSTDLL